MKVPYGYLDRQFNADVAEKIWQTRVKAVVTSGDFTLGKEVKIFEEAFAKAMGAKHCLGVANGTDALELGIWAFGFPRNSEIIVPVNTFYASAASIVTQNMVPVFVDVNEKFVIDPDKIEDAITQKTKAIMPVHFAGQPCDMKKIMAIAQKHGLKVIEDAAQAADAVSNAGPCGTVGDVAEVSFHPQKNLNGWGDGGAILTNHKWLYEKLWLFRNHGLVDRDTCKIASRNSRLDSVHAAVLNYFLPALHEDNNRRIEIAKVYSEWFKGSADVPTPGPDERHTYHLYMMRVKNRDTLLSYLRDHHIGALIHYPKPLHLQQAFKYLDYEVGDFPVAESYAREMISLPIHQYMTDEEVDYTIKVATECMVKGRSW